jgi:molybdate transport system ATP-binding protein
MTHLHARFKLQRGAFQLDAELRTPLDGITALFGPSGCGKTTLLRAIAGLERDPDGQLQIGDQCWQGPGNFVATHRRSIGYVFQEANLFPHMSVEQNLRYGYHRVAAEKRRLSFDEVVELMGVDPLIARHPHDLSGGERQRVAIARALLSSPRLLLMDEPLAGLDEASKSEIIPYLERLRDQLELPILYVSHAFDEVARIADYLALIEKGAIYATGPIAELLTRADLPLVFRNDAESIIAATVAGQDSEFQLVYLDFPGGRFTVVSPPVELGHSVRLRILARDVSLALQEPRQSSILNVFPAQVVAILQESPAQVTVSLDLGGTTLLSRITGRSASNLALKPGSQVYAQVKSVALLT